MYRRPLSLLLASACFSGPAFATVPDLEGLMEQASLRGTIRSRNESALVEELTAVEQARTSARSRSDYGVELRPSISDNDAGLALRVYLPDRWSKKRLQEQLALAAEAEQLRVAALQWSDVVMVYREFSTYRRLQRQIAVTDEELRFIEPYLRLADASVERNELAVNDRARLYSSYLDLLNDRYELGNAFLETRRTLRLVLGPDADLDRLAGTARIEMPSQLEIKTLLRDALEQRADYRRLGVEMHSMQLAEEAARNEDGFRLKYIQPAWRVNYNDGSDGWEVSAAIVLPWGTRNPDIAVYQHQQALFQAALSQQERLIEDRLRATLELANAYYAHASEQQRRIRPVLETLSRDLEGMAGIPLSQVRDVLAIRERMLDASLQAADTSFRSELLAIDLAEELGRW